MWARSPELLIKFSFQQLSGSEVDINFTARGCTQRRTAKRHPQPLQRWRPGEASAIAWFAGARQAWGLDC